MPGAPGQRAFWGSRELVLVLKRVSEDKVRLLKAEAARRGLSLSKAVEEAIELWARSQPGTVVEDEDVDDAVWLRERERLEREHAGKYVVIYDGRIVGVYDSLEEVAEKLRELKSRGARRAVLVRPGVDKGREEGEWLGGSMEPR